MIYSERRETLQNTEKYKIYSNCIFNGNKDIV